MSRPESFNKKELEKRRLQKRKQKDQRKEERKASNSGGGSLDSMMAYVDEDGNITSTPPDPLKRKNSIKEEDIVIGSRNVGKQLGSAVRTGSVTFFNNSKGFGFIKDSDTGESIFVHSKSLIDPIGENDKVTYTTERGIKGLNALNVKLVG